jgi:hypothetical protein
MYGHGNVFRLLVGAGAMLLFGMAFSSFVFMVPSIRERRWFDAAGAFVVMAACLFFGGTLAGLLWADLHGG